MWGNPRLARFARSAGAQSDNTIPPELHHGVCRGNFSDFKVYAVLIVFPQAEVYFLISYINCRLLPVFPQEPDKCTSDREYIF